MYELIASPAWYVPTIFALIAVILLFQGSARQNARLKWIGITSALIAAGIIAVSSYLESGQEKAVRRTMELADSVDKRDWKRFASYLDEDVSFDRYKGRDTLVQGAEKTIVIGDIKNITLGNISIKSEPGSYVVDFTATAEIAEAGRRIPTTWRFYWLQPANTSESLLYRIEYVPSPQLSDSEVKTRLK